MVLDTTGYDLYPMLQQATQQFGVDVVLLLGVLKAESGLNPQAARYGAWPDVSFGLCQMTVQTAKAYGIGDGTPASTEEVRQKLFDRQTAITVCARYLAWAGSFVHSHHPDWRDDEFRIGCCIVYNGGSGALDNPNYFTQFADNVKNYERNLAAAHEALGRCPS